MDNTREKLVELLDHATEVFRFDAWENTDKIADHLIAHGVKIVPKRETDLTGKCGSCAYAKPVDREHSKVYVCCTNKELLLSYTRNRKHTFRPRTTKACKHYKPQGEV